MGKRIIRLFGKDILEEAEGLIGYDVNVVLQSGDSYLGVVKGCENERIALTDHRNYHHEFPVSSIESIIFDRSSAW